MERISRLVAMAALAVALIFILYHVRKAYGVVWVKGVANFAHAAKGVEVRIVGAVAGTGNPILVPGGVDLLLVHQFQLMNERGRTQEIVLCNGHPDYDVLIRAVQAQREDRERRVLIDVRFSPEPVNDPHLAGGWWKGHLEFTGHLRFAARPRAPQTSH